MDSIYFLEMVVSVLFMSMVAQTLSKRFKVPVIIFLLIEGILVGPEFLNFIDPATFGDGLTAIVSLSVAVIVFDGGLHIDVKSIRPIQKTALKLTTIGVLITFLGATLITYLLLDDVNIKLAALFGALVAATGPTVITPLVRNIHVNHKVGKILEIEGVFNDAASVIIAAFTFEWIVSQLYGFEAVAFILQRLVIGTIIGLLSGYLLKNFLSRGSLVTDQTARFFTLTLVMSSYVISELLGNESGILAAAIFGIVTGTSNIPHKQALKEFKSDLVMMMLSIIFILLAAMLDFQDIISLGFKGIIVVLLLIFIVRPMAVFGSTINSRLKTNEKIFISFIGPRGVVPASIATYFAVKLDSMGVLGGQTLVGLVFLTVIITVVMTGTLARRVANFLGVIPMEILIIGGGEVGKILAERFEKRGENVVVVDNSEEKCQRLLKQGIRAIHGDAEDINVLKEAGIEKAKYVVATTDQDNTNLLVSQIAKSKFNRREEQIVARVNNVENLHAFWDLSIRSMSPQMTTALVLDNMVGKPSMFSMCEVGEEGEILEIRVTNPKVAGKAIKELNLPENSLLLMIRRGDKSFIANGNLVLEYDDLVTVIGEGDAAKEVADILYR
ncbi:cation:proton antiporter domain-containing protein [Methanolobus profundi]|uniref:NhaP-type Na+/H+ or K+/H+ antiporter n=1 Tax=Methanolobus profundi TaxID=487685 RepID=A0A1I4UA08_9EURY|nr:cation:proton antiporter [Methanolobus profundi]SFM85755.1 NhaP-type Na+/H+ or K+/H+ antiporter [Methanolobus profundi]